MDMAINDGRFKKGERRSPATEFKPGEHWRPRRPYWDKEWLEREYITNQRSAQEIAEQFDVGSTAILFWLKKHGIPARNTAETRAVKHWGLTGENNPMFGRTGKNNHNWKGGCTPERQAFYMSKEWTDAVSEVWRRDNSTCRRCGKKGSHLHVHHIVSFTVKETRADPNNLILVCRECHLFIHSRKNVNSEFLAKEVQE